jgi:hypothetical protein
MKIARCNGIYLHQYIALEGVVTYGISPIYLLVNADTLGFSLKICVIYATNIGHQCPIFA